MPDKDQKQSFFARVLRRRPREHAQTFPGYLGPQASDESASQQETASQSSRWSLVNNPDDQASRSSEQNARYPNRADRHCPDHQENRSDIGRLIAPRPQQNADAQFPILADQDGWGTYEQCEECFLFSRQADRLCTACKKASAPRSLVCKGFHGLDKGRLGSLGQILERAEACSFCSLIVHTLKRNWRITDDRDLQPHLKKLCTINPVPNANPPNSNWTYYQLHIKYEPGEIPRLPFMWEPTLLLRLSNEAPISRNLIKTTVNFHKVLGWLGQCHRLHGLSCIDPRTPEPPDTFRLVDVQRRCVVVAPKQCRYVTLSYVWGAPRYRKLILTKTNMQRLERPGALTDKVLPATLDEAIYVCHALGEAYLWIDSLCIVQDDNEKRRIEINRMGDIFANSFLTLIAAAGDNADAGLPGVHHRIRNVNQQSFLSMDIEAVEVLPNFLGLVENSVWNTRGWTFQERLLSRRCLFFTETQVFFKCQRMVCHEDATVDSAAGRLVTNVNFDPHSRSMYHQSMYQAPNPFINYKLRVAEYSMRNLSSQSDILDAFLGISKKLFAPYKESFFYGLPQSNFHEALIWEPDPADGPFRQRFAQNSVLPSWSWISHHGHVRYPEEPFVGSLIDVKICTEAGAEPVAPKVTKPRINDDRFETGTRDVFNSLHGTSGSAPSTNADIPKPAINVPDMFFGYNFSSSYNEPIPESSEPTTLSELSTTPGRLSFRCQTAFFHLKESTLPAPPSPNGIILTLAITDPSGTLAGFIDMDQTWTSLYLPPTSPSASTDTPDSDLFQFLALSISETPEKWLHRLTALTKRDGEAGLYFDGSTGMAFAPPATVNVILVQWHEGVARRVGLGKIFQRAWREAGVGFVDVVLE